MEAGARERGASGSASNQHELNGSLALRELLGGDEFKGAATLWIDLVDHGAHVTRDMRASWYDARRDNPERAAEWRLYYSGAPDLAEGDVIALLARSDSPAPIFFWAAAGSTWAAQVEGLLELPEAGSGTTQRILLSALEPHYLLVLEAMLEAAGIATSVSEPRAEDRELLLARFGRAGAIGSGIHDTHDQSFGFPSTRAFSAFAREHVDGAGLDADRLLMAWWSREEELFRCLENFELSQRLSGSPSFKDSDDFLRYSLSVHNRRKSRAGRALEHHVEALLEMRGVAYSRGKRTEGSRTPDFIFPGIDAYRSMAFPADRLLMLGVKTTCKDRWRQILSEAARVKRKHLLTLEPSISSQQFAEMREEQVSIVTPTALHSTHATADRESLVSVEGFIELAADLPPR